jgi:hypothetical protein
MAESVKSVTPEPVDVETRRVVNMMCNVKPKDESCELLVRCQISVMPFLPKYKKSFFFSLANEGKCVKCWMWFSNFRENQLF